MKTPTQTNAIDFDSAKLQRLGFGQQTPLIKQPVSLGQLRQQLGLQLQTSLEPQRILGLFFREVQRLVPLDALAFQHPSHDLRLELGERAPHSAGYRLSHEGEYLGELIFRRKQRFAEDELIQLEALLASLLFPLRNALLYRTALQSALRDPLTDTGNRIAMDQVLQREVDLARRNLQPLSLLMLDIDHFKSINDNHGHTLGDEVLKAVAQTLKNQLRNIDMVFRYGGEEFVIVMPDTALDQGVEAMTRLQRELTKRFFLEGNERLLITFSAGVAQMAPDEQGADAIKRADQGMYLAKRSGKNRVVAV